jgi:hypothetical protein
MELTCNARYSSLFSQRLLPIGRWVTTYKVLQSMNSPSAVPPATNWCKVHTQRNRGVVRWSAFFAPSAPAVNCRLSIYPRGIYLLWPVSFTRSRTAIPFVSCCAAKLFLRTPLVIPALSATRLTILRIVPVLISVVSYLVKWHSMSLFTLSVIGTMTDGPRV